MLVSAGDVGSGDGIQGKKKGKEKGGKLHDGTRRGGEEEETGRIIRRGRERGSKKTKERILEKKVGGANGFE
jgi:hypothetical protein